MDRIDFLADPLMGPWIRFVCKGPSNDINEERKILYSDRFFLAAAYDSLFAGGVYLIDDQGKPYQYNIVLYLFNLPDGSKLQLQDEDFDIWVYTDAEMIAAYGPAKIHDIHKAAYHYLTSDKYITSFSNEIIKSSDEIVKKMQDYIYTQGVLCETLREFHIPSDVAESIGNLLEKKDRELLICPPKNDAERKAYVNSEAFAREKKNTF